MSEQAPPSVEEAFDPILRTGQFEWETYLNNRPYEDRSGIAHHPRTGTVINPNEYFVQQREIAEITVQDIYEEMTMPQLARKLAVAEHHEDRTATENITTALLDKMAEFEVKNASSRRERPIDHNAYQSDNLWNRVMGVKARELEKLRTQSPANDKSATDLPETADSDNNPEPPEEEYVPNWTIPFRESEEVTPQSSAPNAGEERQAEEGSGGSFRDQVKVQYAPDKHNQVRLGLEFTELGDVMDWPQHKWTRGVNRDIIVETKDGKKFYITGDEIYDLTESVRKHQPIGGELTPDGEIPKVVIGEPWQLKPDLITEPVIKVEIGYKVASGQGVGEEGGMLDDEFTPRGEDPFAAANKLLDSLEKRPGLFRKLRELPMFLHVKALSVLEDIHDYHTDEEKGRRRTLTAAIGGVALAGITYVALTKNLDVGFNPGDKNHHLHHVHQALDQGGHHRAEQVAHASCEHAPKQVHHHHNPAASQHHRGSESLVKELPSYNAKTRAGTIDHLVLQQAHSLGYHFSDASQAEHLLTQHTLHINGLSWDDARHLPDGYRVQLLHPEQIKELLKTIEE